MKSVQKLAEILFPQTCNICNKRIFQKTDLFCVSCFEALEKTHIQDFKNNLILDKFKGLSPIRHAFSMYFVSKDNLTSQILYQIKYDGNTKLAESMGIIVGKRLIHSIFSNADSIIPIPLHKAKESIRGYNQSERIAQGIASIIPLTIDTESTIRTKHTSSQTFLSKEARQENVKDVFEVIKPQRIVGKKIILLDDVITTGATVETCTRELLKAGANEVMLLSLAVANDI
jgi:ComF family protein